MRSLIVPLALSLDAFAEAVSLPSVHDSSSFESTQSEWSRQDVFTFISVCVAVAGILTAVLVAAPRKQHGTRCIRHHWHTQAPSSATITPATFPSQLHYIRLTCHTKVCAIAINRRQLRRQNDTRRRLQERYEDYVRFNEFLELVE